MAQSSYFKNPRFYTVQLIRCRLPGQKLKIVRSYLSEALSHAEAKEGIIIYGGVGGVELPELRGEVQGIVPVGFYIFQQPQPFGYAGHMHIERAYELVRLNLFPYAEIHSLGVFAHHPPQVHIDALAGRVTLGRGYVLRGARGMLYRKKVVMKMYERLLHCCLFILPAWHKCIFQRIALPVVVLQEGDKIKQVGGIKGAVCEADKLFQIGVVVVEDKIMRVVIHPLHEFAAVVDDGGTVAPGKHGGKEPCYLYILLLSEGMGYGYGVFFNKGGLIVEGGFCIEELVKRLHRWQFWYSLAVYGWQFTVGSLQLAVSGLSELYHPEIGLHVDYILTLVLKFPIFTKKCFFA